MAKHTVQFSQPEIRDALELTARTARASSHPSTLVLCAQLPSGRRCCIQDIEREAALLRMIDLIQDDDDAPLNPIIYSVEATVSGAIEDEDGKWDLDGASLTLCEDPEPADLEGVCLIVVEVIHFDDGAAGTKEWPARADTAHARAGLAAIARVELTGFGVGEDAPVLVVV